MCTDKPLKQQDVAVIEGQGMQLMVVSDLFCSVGSTWDCNPGSDLPPEQAFQAHGQPASVNS